MRIVCAWCDKHLTGDRNEKLNISHGLCNTCGDKIKREIEQMKMSKKQTLASKPHTA
jgi:hypothetical protein